MTVARNESVAVANLEQVAVAISPAGAENDTIANGAHRCARRRGVISTLVLLPHAEDRVESPAEGARDASEFEGRAQKRRAHRFAVLIEEVATHTLARVANRLQLRAGECEGCRENFSDAHGTTGRR